mgnify:CR=1 FL=1
MFVANQKPIIPQMKWVKTVITEFKRPIER